MHSDLIDIQNLWSVDSELDALRAEATALGAAITKARAALEVREQRVNDLVARLEAERAEELQLNKRLTSYSKKRDDTRKLIDEGRAPDFLVAQRQFEQCAEIADQCETDLLERMEAIEALEAELEVARNARDHAGLIVQGAITAQSKRRPGLEQRYRELEPARVERWGEIADQYRTRYEDLRRRGRTVLVNIRKGTCEACHIEVSAQVLVEVAKGSRVHNCRGCMRFFWDIRVEAEEE